MTKSKRILYIAFLIVFLVFCTLSIFAGDVEEHSKSEMDSSGTLLKTSVHTPSLTQYSQENRKVKEKEAISHLLPKEIDGLFIYANHSIGKHQSYQLVSYIYLLNSSFLF